MAEFTPLENGGTHLSLRCANPEGRNPVARALVRAITRLAMAKQLVSEQRASKSRWSGWWRKMLVRGGGGEGGVGTCVNSEGPTDHTRCDDGVVPLICPTCQMVS